MQRMGVSVKNLSVGEELQFKQNIGVREEYQNFSGVEEFEWSIAV